MAKRPSIDPDLFAKTEQEPESEEAASQQVDTSTQRDTDKSTEQPVNTSIDRHVDTSTDRYIDTSTDQRFGPRPALKQKPVVLTVRLMPDVAEALEIAYAKERATAKDKRLVSRSAIVERALRHELEIGED